MGGADGCGYDCQHMVRQYTQSMAYVPIANSNQWIEKREEGCRCAEMLYWPKH